MTRPYSMTVLAILIASTFISRPAHGQAAPATVPVAAKSDVATPQKLPSDIVDYFSGDWSGEGEFASGKKIEADISFHADLDNQWLAYRHTDRPPGQYKAAGMWGFQRTSHAFVMTLNDNFGGARNFSSDGWQDGKIVFERAVDTQKRERFTFLREAGDRMKMSYEVSADGSHWKLVDHLIFHRR